MPKIKHFLLIYGVYNIFGMNTIIYNSLFEL